MLQALGLALRNSVVWKKTDVTSSICKKGRNMKSGLKQGSYVSQQPGEVLPGASRTMSVAVAGSAFRHLLSTWATMEAPSLTCLMLVTHGS